MMRNKSYLRAAIALMICGIAGCAAHQPVTSVAAQKPAVDYPIITRVVSRHYTIVVASGEDGPVYTVMGNDGNPLVDHITLAAMKVSNLKLFNSISPALAMRDVDASAD